MDETEPTDIPEKKESAIFLPESHGGFNFVLQLRINFVNFHDGRRARGKPTIRVQSDSLRRKMFQSRLDSLYDRLDRIHDSGLTTDTPKTNFNVFWQMSQDRHLAPPPGQ